MPFTAIPTALPGVLVIEPKMFEDARGFFFESFNAHDFEALTGLAPQFVQDNHSRSAKNVLRGLHYQVLHPQAKLVRVVQGEVFDVAVDLRRTSPTFGQWTGTTLSAENRRQLWIPEGFAHGIAVTSEWAEVLYKATDHWYPAHERSVLWNDAALAIDWPLTASPLLAAKDAAAVRLAEADLYET